MNCEKCGNAMVRKGTMLKCRRCGRKIHKSGRVMDKGGRLPNLSVEECYSIARGRA